MRQSEALCPYVQDQITQGSGRHATDLLHHATSGSLSTSILAVCQYGVDYTANMRRNLDLLNHQGNYIAQVFHGSGDPAIN